MLKRWTAASCARMPRSERGAATNASTAFWSSLTFAGLAHHSRGSEWTRTVSYTHLTLPTKRIV